MGYHHSGIIAGCSFSNKGIGTWHCIYMFCVYPYLFSVGWGSDQRGFGEEPGVKAQIINLIRSVRTVMKSKLSPDIFIVMCTYKQTHTDTYKINLIVTLFNQYLYCFLCFQFL